MLLRRLLVSYVLALSAGSAWSQPWDNNDPQIQSRSQALLYPGSIQSFETSKTSNGYRDGVAPEPVETALSSGHLQHMINALEVMQSHFYELWIGTWPTAIDWTAAVINTHVSAALRTITNVANGSEKERYSKIINKFFSHNTAYYFGEDAFSIRNEAYDDILWVVLGWLESIKFIQHRNATEDSWHGTQFIPAFAHRSRLFWDIASRGWDTSLCGGGMIWNPNLIPYKNAITNQLFISASIAMYLYSPGDSIDFPFMADIMSSDSMPGRPHDPKYLHAATNAYTWLKHSNMTNKRGLYVDGFHITGWGRNGGRGSGKCDERNEMVYTYNQGVILSGLRGLWEGTGDSAYLQDGYELVRNVIAATGWTWSGNMDSPFQKASGWSGLGQGGILEELCDRGGSCSQDAQTFKGIFFQHLTQFCEPLPADPTVPGKTYGASKRLREKHDSLCDVFGRWVLHNAKAALGSRDESGLFGMWWGQDLIAGDTWITLPSGASDYRNNATVLLSGLWTPVEMPRRRAAAKSRPQQSREGSSSQESARSGRPSQQLSSNTKAGSRKEDVNDRGRGRTVETQGGGLAVLRSAWELLNDHTP